MKKFLFGFLSNEWSRLTKTIFFVHSALYVIKIIYVFLWYHTLMCLHTSDCVFGWSLLDGCGCYSKTMSDPNYEAFTPLLIVVTLNLSISYVSELFVTKDRKLEKAVSILVVLTNIILFAYFFEYLSFEKLII